VKRQCNTLCKYTGFDGHLPSSFTSDELAHHALQLLKCRKTNGTVTFHYSFLNTLRVIVCCDCGSSTSRSCLDHVATPTIWRKATITAVPKPNKSMENPWRYRTIALLCIRYKLLERLLFWLEHRRPMLTTQQGGFRSGHSTLQQVFKLTSDIKESYEGRRKAGLTLVDVTAAYDTAWHQGLVLKLLQTIPD